MKRSKEQSTFVSKCFDKPCKKVEVVNPNSIWDWVYINTNPNNICQYLHHKESVYKLLERIGVVDMQ